MPIFSSDIQRNRFLTWWAGVVTSRPWMVLIVSLMLAAGSIALTATRLRFDSDRSDLVDPSLDWQKRYAEFKDAFPRWSDAIVVVDGASSDPVTTDAFIHDLAGRLRADERFPHVDAGFPAADAPAGLILAEPVERMREIVDGLRAAAPVLSAPSLADLLRPTLLLRDLDEEHRRGMIDLLTRAQAIAHGDVGVSLIDLGPETQRLRVGDLAVILVALPAPEGGRTVAAHADAIGALRAHIAQARADTRFANIDAGVTGIPVLETDEAAQSTADATKASIVAFALIAGLLMWMYRGVVIPAIAMTALLIGVAWSFGYLTIAVGRLQLLSVVFAVILLGLGVDTAIHLIARLELVHPDHDHMPAAVAQTFRGVGPGIITGSLTTAAAFGAVALTDFKGVAEMGVIAAGGVILCAISVMSIFPALLEIVPHPEKMLRTRRGGESLHYAKGRLAALDRRPRFFLAGWAIALIGAAALAAGVKYDTDLLGLLPDTIESVRWERRLEQEDEKSAWHAVVVCADEGEAERLTGELRGLSEVASVGGAGILFPADIEEKQAILRSLPPVPERTGVVDAGGSWEALRDVCRVLADGGAHGHELSSLFASIGSLGRAQLERVEGVYDRDRVALTKKVRALRVASAPSRAQIPGCLTSGWVGTNDELLLRVYAAPPEGGAQTGGVGGILSRERLDPFAEAVLAVAPNATGPIVQIYESTRLISRAYVKAMVLAFVAIFVLLWLDFRSVLDVLCALVPVFAGIVLLLALMRVVGESLNFANTIVMPLIVGLGVDSGVHAVHRWRQQPMGRPAGLAGGSGRAITLTTATTAIGFACMMLGEHRGVRSLGFVMSAGLVLVWSAVVFLLPALLRVRTPMEDSAIGPEDCDDEVEEAAEPLRELVGV